MTIDCAGGHDWEDGKSQEEVAGCRELSRSCLYDHQSSSDWYIYSPCGLAYCRSCNQKQRQQATQEMGNYIKKHLHGLRHHPNRSIKKTADGSTRRERQMAAVKFQQISVDLSLVILSVLLSIYIYTQLTAVTVLTPQ